MSDFKKMRNIITKFPPKNEYGDDYYEIKEYNDGYVIYFATDDSYCWASLYFNKQGKFIGFVDDI